ncbi:MAG TPA: hypothetical protein VD835_03535 [Pyrinomonadaceae bacterium]|nr:hypothetical protein [Pyrinomonadaceae bacterium]
MVNLPSSQLANCLTHIAPGGLTIRTERENPNEPPASSVMEKRKPFHASPQANSAG